MSTITTLQATDSGSVSRPIINTNFTNLNTDKAELSGATFTGAISATNLSGTNTGDQTLTSLGAANNTLSNLGTVALTQPLLPNVTDAIALGSITKMWSDLFLASGGVINWDNGEVTLTHSSNNLAISGGNLTVTDGVQVGNTAGVQIRDSGNNAYGVITFGDAMSTSRTLSLNLNDANRTISLGSNFVLPADPNADRILFWDDSAGSTAYLTLGSGLTISGDTISVTGGGGGGTGITWTEVTGTSQTASVNAGYIANNASLVTITLPTTAAVGDIVRVSGKGAGLWRVSQNASEIIHFGNLDSTTGTGGYIAATHRRDAVELVCVVADTEWNVLSSTGNITVA